SALFLWRRRLYETRPLLWALMLAVPFPYIATTAGWMTAELGRQPWLIHGLMRTIKGAIPKSAYSPINPSSVNNPFPVETCGEGCSCCLSCAKSRGGRRLQWKSNPCHTASRFECKGGSGDGAALVLPWDSHDHGLRDPRRI